MTLVYVKSVREGKRYWSSEKTCHYIIKGDSTVQQCQVLTYSPISE
jgi:hypothetical protein